MKSNRGFLYRRTSVLIVACLAVIAAGFILTYRGVSAQNEKSAFTSGFRVEDCGGFNTEGENPYFILKPGYQLAYEDEGEGLVITVPAGRFKNCVEVTETRRLSWRQPAKRCTVPALGW